MFKKKSVPDDKTLVGSVNIRPSDDKTMLREIALYNDRWSAYGENTGIVSISPKLSVEQLKAYEIFQGYDDAFLTKICPDISVATWKRDAILFKEGDYIDMAFFIASGGIDVYLQQTTHDDTPVIQPIFDEGRTMVMSMDQIKRDMPKQASTPQALLRPAGTVAPKAAENTICFLSSMDFDLPKGGWPAAW